MKRWDNGVVSMAITSCMSCPEKKQIMAKRKVSGQWVTALRGVLCKRTGMAVRLMGIAESCPLPEYEEATQPDNVQPEQDGAMESDTTEGVADDDINDDK